MSEQLPFGDPCPTCGAGTKHADPRDHVCMCKACWKCSAASLSTCAYCDESLGCKEHRLAIEQHVEKRCNTTPAQRARFEAFVEANSGHEHLCAAARAAMGAP